MNVDTILKRFDTPDEVRTFDKGKLEIVSIARLTSLAGSGRCTSGRRSASVAVTSSISASSFPGTRPRRSTMAGFLI